MNDNSTPTNTNTNTPTDTDTDTDTPTDTPPGTSTSTSSGMPSGKPSRTTARDATEKGPVTVLGLGPMGEALAGAFVAAGHPTTVWNRTASKASALVERGATLAANPAEAVAASPLVIACVLNYDAVHAILDPVADTLSGRTLVNLTADAPTRAREMAEWAARHGVDYLDGAIMTPAPTIGTPDAAYLYSGPEQVLAAHAPTLDAFAGNRTYLGEDPGRAAAYEVAVLDFFWTSVSGFTHALALARTEGIEAYELAPFAHGIAAIFPMMIDDYAERLDKGDYERPNAMLLSGSTAMGHIAHTAHANGLDTGVLRAAKALVDRAVAEGHGAKDLAYLSSVHHAWPGEAGEEAQGSTAG